MNAAILVLSLTAGGDPGPGCCGAPAAAAPSDACCGAAKPGILDRLKGRLGHKAKADCGCDPCAGGPANLLDALKGRRAKHHKAADCGGCDPCAAAPAAPATPADPPKDMPKPKDPAPPKADAPKGGNAGAVLIPPLPVTPASGAKLNGADSPY